MKDSGGVMEDAKKWRQKAEVYRLLGKFYAGDLSAGAVAVKQIAKLLKLGLRVPVFDNAGQFDYNRLFVGPQKLLAPPLESYYRNEEHLPMQAETMAVRRAYAEAGVELTLRNKVPDDHAQFEFYFLGCLSEVVERYRGEAIAFQAEEQYQRFLQEHLFLWIFAHLRAVKTQSTSAYCQETAGAIDVFMQWEKEAVSHEV